MKFPAIPAIAFIAAACLLVAGCTSPGPGANATVPGTNLTGAAPSYAPPAAGTPGAFALAFFDDQNNRRYENITGYLFYVNSQPEFRQTFAAMMEQNWNGTNLSFENPHVTGVTELDPDTVVAGITNETMVAYWKEHVSKFYVVNVTATMNQVASNGMKIRGLRTLPIYVLRAGDRWELMLPEEGETPGS